MPLLLDLSLLRTIMSASAGISDEDEPSGLMFEPAGPKFFGGAVSEPDGTIFWVDIGRGILEAHRPAAAQDPFECKSTAQAAAAFSRLRDNAQGKLLKEKMESAAKEK